MLESGGNNTSFSAGYCESPLTSAPMSISPGWDILNSQRLGIFSTQTRHRKLSRISHPRTFRKWWGAARNKKKISKVRTLFSAHVGDPVEETFQNFRLPAGGIWLGHVTSPARTHKGPLHPPAAPLAVCMPKQTQSYDKRDLLMYKRDLLMY